MPSAGLSASDRNLLLQIERNSITRFDPGDVSDLVDRGLVQHIDGALTLTRKGRLAVNGAVAQEWRGHLSALVRDTKADGRRRSIAR